MRVIVRRSFAVVRGDRVHPVLPEPGELNVTEEGDFCRVWFPERGALDLTPDEFNRHVAAEDFEPVTPDVEQFHDGLAVIEREIRAGVRAEKANVDVTFVWLVGRQRYGAFANVPLADVGLSLETFCRSNRRVEPERVTVPVPREQADDSAGGRLSPNAAITVREVVAILSQ